MKLANIVKFLISWGWDQQTNQGNYFDRFYPPANLNLPQGYYLEIPKIESGKGFQRYADGLLEVIAEIYRGMLSDQDIRHVFASNDSIFSLSIVDMDTQLGSIKLERFKKGIDSLFNVIKQGVIFVVSGRQIFGEAKSEIINYLDGCRNLQSAKGSYVTKFKLPNVPLNLFNQESVPNKLIDVIEFINREIINQNLNEINEQYVLNNREFINIELLIAIKGLYKNANIIDAKISLLTFDGYKSVPINRINEKIDHFEKYIKIVKNILLNETPLEIVGNVFRLISKDPQTSGVIWVETEIADEKQIVEVTLNSRRYLEAIEAHKQEKKVQIKGLAKQKRDRYFIQDVDLFLIR